MDKKIEGGVPPLSNRLVLVLPTRTMWNRILKVDSPPRIYRDRKVEDLLKNYGLPTALLVGISAWAALLVNFLKGLITKELGELKHNQELLAKELRRVQDDIARIELMLRLSHDMAKGGSFSPEMSRIGKAGTDVDLQ